MYLFKTSDISLTRSNEGDWYSAVYLIYFFLLKWRRKFFLPKFRNKMKYEFWIQFNNHISLFLEYFYFISSKIFSFPVAASLTSAWKFLLEKTAPGRCKLSPFNTCSGPAIRANIATFCGNFAPRSLHLIAARGQVSPNCPQWANCMRLLPTI